MTHKQWVKLSPKEQRIKVAKLCGWTHFRRVVFSGDHKKDGLLFGSSQKQPRQAWNFETNEIPDYLNDLNAMHEAEKFIPLPKWYEWLNALGRATGEPEKDEDSTPLTVLAVYRATAAQRAEAFVLTMEGAK